MTKIIEETTVTAEDYDVPNILVAKISSYQNNLIALTRATKKLESIVKYFDGADLSVEDVELNESVPSSFYEQFDMLNDDLSRLMQRIYNALNRITDK